MGASGPVCPLHPVPCCHPGPALSACIPTRGKASGGCSCFLPWQMRLFSAIFHSVLGPSRRHSVLCVLPHVSLLTEQRSRREPQVPSPTSPMSEQGEASLGVSEVTGLL